MASGRGELNSTHANARMFGGDIHFTADVCYLNSLCE